MRIARPLLLALSVLGSHVFAQDSSANVPKQKHDYQVCKCVLFNLSSTSQGTGQSDVARLRKIVINRYDSLSQSTAHS